MHYKKRTMAIDIGSHVKLEIDGEESEFVVVDGSNPDNLGDSVITSTSQIGQELMGKNPGDQVELIIEGNPRVYRIVEVN